MILNYAVGLDVARGTGYASNEYLVCLHNYNTIIRGTASGNTSNIFR